MPSSTSTSNPDTYTAQLVFETVPHKDVVSWNTLINGYSQQGFRYSSFVLDLFRRMRGENASPDSHTFAGVCNAASYVKDVLGGGQVHTVAVKAVGCFDVFVGSSLVNMYCKMGFVLVRNSVTWATMISGWVCNATVGCKCVRGFYAARRSEEREEENEFVLTAVLSGLGVPEFVDTGKQIHCLAVKNGLMCVMFSVGNALVTMYAKCGSLDDALRTFELSGDKNSITWSAMISGFAQSGDSEKALDLFSDMHFSGIVPTEFAIWWGH